MLKGNLYQVVSQGEGTATVRLLPESPIYKAHFPGYPVTPGVTIVQMGLECMGRKLAAAKDIKFVVPVLPTADGPCLRYDWTFRDPDTADITVTRLPGTLCAKMTVTCL